MILPYLCWLGGIMSQANRILYAQKDGNYYLRFIGDVRVTFCTTLNTYLEQLFKADDIRSVAVDLRMAAAVDSTTLGLLAKLALYVNRNAKLKPLLIVEDESMIRLIQSMGLDDIFSLADAFPDQQGALEELELSHADTEMARVKVIDAHRTLMKLNNRNMDAFSDLVKRLETEANES